MSRPEGSFSNDLIRSYVPSGRGINPDLNELREIFRNPPCGIGKIDEPFVEEFQSLGSCAIGILVGIANLWWRSRGREKVGHRDIFERYKRVFACFRLADPERGVSTGTRVHQRRALEHSEVV